MFSDVKADSAQRITEIREFIEATDSLIPAAPAGTPRHLNTAKGLVFVQLYGLIEFTINRTIAKTIYYINAAAPLLNDLHEVVWGMVLNAELDSLIHVNRAKWEKRHIIFDRIKQNPISQIADNIIPTNGDNYTHAQLESIWKTFSISDPLFNEPRFQGRLKEIVGNRINIAHGNASSADVGASITTAELIDRLNDVSAYCSYLISVFEEYVKNRKFLKPSPSP